MKLPTTVIAVPSDFRVTIHIPEHVLNFHVQDIKPINSVLATNKHQTEIFAGVLFIIRYLSITMWYLLNHKFTYLRGSNLVFIYASTYGMCKYPYRGCTRVGSPVPGRLFLAPDQGKESFHDRAASDPHLLVGQMPGCPGKYAWEIGL